MPRRRDRIDLIYYLIYILIALLLLKLFGFIPGSPQYETVNIVLTGLSLIVAAVTAFQQWLSGRFRGLEDQLSELNRAMRGVEDRLTRVEGSIEAVKLAERIARLEGRLEKNS